MKKKKLVLLQPQKYNELFSTYHSFKKTKKYLPTIPSNLQKDLEIMSYTTRTNDLAKSNFNNKSNFTSNKNSYIFKRNKNFFNSLMTYQNTQDNFQKNEFLPFPSLIQTYKKVDENSKKKKKYEIKKSNCNIIYLNLSNETNKSNSDYTVEQIDKNEFVNEKIKEINSLKKQKIKEILNKNEKTKIKNDLQMVNNIPVILINFFAEDIYNNINSKNSQENNNSNNNKDNKISNNSNSSKKIINFDNINKNIYKNNTFFQFILNNVKRKIELLNDSNKSLSILYVKNLINSELSDLKKNIENYFIEYNKHTSDNISKISNYEITPSNTFRFKTNNSKIINSDNNANDPGVLGNLIKSNIFSKKNEGSKKLYFDNTNSNKKAKEKSIFQNKEIIFSIHQNTTRGKVKYKNIKKINIPKIIQNLKNSRNQNNKLEMGTDTENTFLRSRYYYKTSPNKKDSKNTFFHKIKKEKTISHSFSEIFLKKNYPKISDCINEISASIEKKYLIKKRKEREKIIQQNEVVQNGRFLSDQKINKNNEKYYRSIEQKNKNNYNNNNVVRLKKEEENENDENDYESIKEENIITPKRSKELFLIFSDNKEKKAKIKNPNMKNNYENIKLDIQLIKQEDTKFNLTPKKIGIKEEKQNKILKTDPSSSLYNGQQSSEDQSPNLIYFDKNKKSKIIYENYDENKTKKQKRKKNKKNARKQNQDLTSIKTSKNSEKNIFRKSINKKMFHQNDNDNKDMIINKDDKNKKRKKKKKKNIEKDVIMNLINNNPNITNKEEIIKKLINNNNEKEEIVDEEDESDDSEEESYEEEEEEEDDENDIINEDNTPKSKATKQDKKNLANKKKKKKKKTSKNTVKQQSDNKINIKLNTENISKEKTKPLNKQIIQNEIINRNNDTETKEIHSTKDSNYIKNNPSEVNNLVINKNKSNIVGRNTFKNRTKNFRNSIDGKKEYIEDNAEYQELVKEMEKYNVTNPKDLYTKKHLTEEKKDKPEKGGIIPKTSDNSFFLLDDNINEIIKKNAPPSNVNINNYNKQEELKIVNEVMELDNLDQTEKSFILSEMLNLRLIIIKSKVINNEVKKKINSKRVSIYKLVNKYFLNAILIDIKNGTVEREKYSNKLKKLEKIQNFGIFTYKNLSILETKYVIPYLDKEERRKLELQEINNKKLREKIALEEFENYKKKQERRKRHSLIYDNSYLFKKEKQKEFKLRKEVEELLNKEYDQNQNHKIRRETPRLMSLINKRKKYEKKNKVPRKRNSISLKRLSMQEEIIENEDNSKRLKELEEQKKEELKDKKLKEFFERIRKLKNGEFKDFDDELNQLINEIMFPKDVAIKNKENRVNSFIQNFEYNRIQNKSYSKNTKKGFNFVSPIRFISDVPK